MKKVLKYAVILGMLCLTACAREPEVPVQERPEAAEATNVPEVTNAPDCEKHPGMQDNSVIPLKIFQGTERLQEWSEGGLLCDVAWEVLTLGEAEAERYPELAKKLEKKNSDSRTAGAVSFAELLPSAKEMSKDREDVGTCMDVTGFYVQRADDRIFSVRIDNVYDEGGIHPTNRVECLNINPETGGEVSLRDVVNDVPKVLGEMERLLGEEYGALLCEDWREILTGYEESDYVWTMDYKGITFYFSPCELGPWSSGLLTVTIGFAGRPEMFVAGYEKTPMTGYAKKVPLGSIMTLDRNREDGKPDYVTIHQTRMNAEDDRLSFEVILNGRSVFEPELCAYDFSVYLVTVGEKDSERYYLYVDALYENENHTLYVLDFNGNRITEIAAELAAGFYTEYNREGDGITEVLLNPEKFTLSFRMDMMRTNWGTKVYTVDEATGLPVEQEGDFRLNEAQAPLVAKLPVEVIMLADNTREVVAVGTEFYFLRTDNESYVEFRISDGRECRVEVNALEWPHTVNGVPEEECFDGIGYAG